MNIFLIHEHYYSFFEIFNFFFAFLCLEYNPCSHKNGGCDQLCEPINDMPACDCTEGYVLLEDGFTCKSKFMMLRIWRYLFTNIIVQSWFLKKIQLFFLMKYFAFKIEVQSWFLKKSLLKGYSKIEMWG